MRIPILLVMLASCAFGQVTETTITDTVRVPVSSGLFNGIVDVRPSHLMTCGTSSYAPVPVQVGVTNGVLSLTLVPNALCGPYDSGGNPASYYTARFVDRTRSATWTETWVVPVSAVSVPLSTIHAAAPASASAAISLSQIAQGSATTNQVLAWSGTTWAPSDIVLTNPLTTAGDILYYNTGLARLAIGTAGQILTAAAGLPAWTSVSTALSSWTGSTSVTAVGGLTSGGFGGTGNPGSSVWNNTDGQLSFSANDLRSAVKLKMSSSDSATWDSQPMGALEIAAPTSPSTRNFVSGLLVTTYSDTADKSRGIFVNNAASKSDGIYVHNVGGGVGVAVETQDAGTPTTNSYGYANQVNSSTSIGFYTYSTAESGGPRLHWLEQRASSAGSPASLITLTGNAAHVAEQVDNAGGNVGAVARRITNGAGQIIQQESAQVPAIEFGNMAAASTPTIDFHSSGNGNDYDARISASGGIASPGFGSLIFEANTLTLNALPFLVDRGEKPTCSISYRGAIWTDFGGAGVADTVEVCTKDASNNYAWRTLL